MRHFVNMNNSVATDVAGDHDNNDQRLKCAFCSARFVYAIKLIPDCGSSICGKCYEELKENLLKSCEYVCRVCKDWHTMSVDGLDDNATLIGLLRPPKPAERVATKAAELGALIGETKEQLAALGPVGRLNAHCDRLVEAVGRSLESKIAHLKQLADEQLRQIKDYRAEMSAVLLAAAAASSPAASPSRPAKRLKRCSDTANESSFYCDASTSQEIADVTADFERFSGRWHRSFAKPSRLSEEELERAREEAHSFSPRIRELAERATTIQSASVGLLEWKENESFAAKRDHLGLLIAKERTPAPAPTRKSQSNVKVEAAESSAAVVPKLEHDRLVGTLFGHSDSVYQAVFLSDGCLASCSEDKSIKIWPRGESEFPFFQLEICRTAAISLAVLANGWLAAGCTNGSVLIWDLANQKFVKGLEGHKYAVFSLRVFGDGRLASVSWDNTIKIWDPFRKKDHLLATLSGHDIKRFGTDLGLLSNGNLVTCSSGLYEKTPLIKVWNPLSQRALVCETPTHTKGASAMLVLADDRVAIGFRDGSIKIFDLEGKLETMTLAKCHDTRVLSLVQLPNGYLASCASRKDSAIKIWDLETGELVESIASGHVSDIWSLNLSPDGRVLSSASGDRTVKLWSMSGLPGLE